MSKLTNRQRARFNRRKRNKKIQLVNRILDELDNDDISCRKFGTTSILFDGVGDYTSLPDSKDWVFPQKLDII